MFELPGRYEPDGNVSKGGMSSVIFCNDNILERHVAIKFINHNVDVRRLLDEINALLKMRSKHVVQIYDVLKDGTRSIAIVQEFVSGPDLVESYKSPPTLSEYYNKLWQISSGISDIHKMDIIHRDIKPNNIKTDKENVIKIFDFGLARNIGSSASTVGFVGTHGFAAPELYSSNTEFTKAVDTFAFGVTAFFLAIGDLPSNLKKTPPNFVTMDSFREIPLSLPNEITDILDKCLSINPSERPLMSNIRDILSKHIMFDRHEALVIHNNRPSKLNSTNRSVRLQIPNVGKIEISYDGLEFKVIAVSGEVTINNNSVSNGDKLPGSCVISIGDSSRRSSNRAFVTFDLSNPETVL
ncbi:TPA: serine/threonine-protein kinase [Yersinia enterocolitica]